MKRTVYSLVITVVTILISSNALYSQNGKDPSRPARKAARTEKLFGGEPVRTAVKLNAAAVVGIVNPAVEFRVHKYITLSLEGLGSFYHDGFADIVNGPAIVAMTFLEARYYPVESFRGFFVGPNVGFSVWNLSKGIHPAYWGSYSEEYQVGTNFMAGLTAGYAFTLAKHWGLEISVGGGCQVGFYEGHYKSDGSMYIGWNGSTEWLPYKAAVSILYKW